MRGLCFDIAVNPSMNPSGSTSALRHPWLARHSNSEARLELCIAQIMWLTRFKETTQACQQTLINECRMVSGKRSHGWCSPELRQDGALREERQLHMARQAHTCSMFLVLVGALMLG